MDIIWLLLLMGAAASDSGDTGNGAAPAKPPPGRRTSPPRQPPLQPPLTFPVPGHTYGRGFGSQLNAFDPSKTVWHDGGDIGAPEGTDIVAVADGYVWQARGPERDDTACGRGCQIRHVHPSLGTFNATYCHMSEVLVSQGQSVKAGQVIGKVGETGTANGAHLHISLWVNWPHTFDPLPWIGGS